MTLLLSNLIGSWNRIGIGMHFYLLVVVREHVWVGGALSSPDSEHWHSRKRKKKQVRRDGKCDSHHDACGSVSDQGERGTSIREREFWNEEGEIVEDCCWVDFDVRHIHWTFLFLGKIDFGTLNSPTKVPLVFTRRTWWASRLSLQKNVRKAYSFCIIVSARNIRKRCSCVETVTKSD